MSEERDVIAALAEAYPPPGGWTTNDLDELPEDGHRRELIDGVLIMTPSPTAAHQTIAMRLGVALEASCPPNLFVTQAVEVRVSLRRSFVPDVLVMTADAATRNPAKVAPHEVVLIVEIVSPGSRTLDRFTKPVLYAEAGIPFYWRIETRGGLAAHTYRLAPGKPGYVESGVFEDVIDLVEPWPIRLPLTQLIPRQLNQLE